MNHAHLQKLSQDELTKGLKPVVNHEFWAFFEEYLRREQHKQVQVLATATDRMTIGQAQGKFNAYQLLAQLRAQLNQ